MDPLLPKVRSGGYTWLDHSKSTIFKRQFLLTDYEADVLRNALAVSITLAGPRLWILLRASSHFVWKHYTQWRSSISPGTAPAADYGDIPMRDLLGHYMKVTGESHSELSAAKDIIRDALQDFRAGGVKLDLPPKHPSSQGVSVQVTNQGKVGKSLRVYLYKLRDLLVSLALIVALVALFAAHTAGAVFSARILGDTMAVAKEPDCSKIDFRSPHMLQRPYNLRCEPYPDELMHCLGEDFELPPDLVAQTDLECPFTDDVCIEPAFGFNSSMVSSSRLGLNSPRTYFVEWKETCAVVDVRHVMTTNFSIHSDKSEAFVPFFSQCQPPSQEVIPIGLSKTLSGDLSFGQCPRVLDPTKYKKTRNDALVTAWAHIVPTSPTTNLYSTGNDSIWVSLPSAVACVHEARICKDVGDCRSIKLYADVNSINAALIDMLDTDTTSIGEELLEEFLLSIAAAAPTMQSIVGDSLHWIAQCRDIDCWQHPGWMQQTHARWVNTYPVAQQIINKFARGWIEGHDLKATLKLPPAFRGLCSLAKFRSEGWRNVSVFTVIGMFSIPCLVAIASIRLDEGLLVGVAALHGFKGLRWCFMKFLATLHALARGCSGTVRRLVQHLSALIIWRSQ